MKKIKFIGMGLLLTISSCNWYSDCNQIPLSKEDSEWFNCYNLDDTIVLKSNLNNYDTLVVTSKKSEYSPCNKFELGINQYQSMWVVLESRNVKMNECSKQLKNDEYIGLRIKSSDEYENTYRRIKAYNLQFQNASYDNYSLINYKGTPVWLKMPYFKDSSLVYKFDDENSRSRYPYVNSEYPCAIKSFHWSKEYGLVQYETENNEVYSLIKK